MQEKGSVLLECAELPSDSRVGLFFSHPIQIHTAWDGAELLTVLDDVDRAAKEGMYAAGYLSYEAGYALEPHAGIVGGAASPLAWFAIYDGRQVIAPGLVRQLDDVAEWHVGKGEYDWTIESYLETFDRVRTHIYDGDVYQINLTGRLRFEVEGSIVGLYGALARAQTNVFGAFVNTGDRQILSRSPELFFHRRGERIIVRPMKGTRVAGTLMADALRQARLLASDQKNRAENLMIVDLLRNDLSVVCEPGSVKVPLLFSTEVHETLVQMTSTVTGRLRPEAHLVDVFRGLFPCGSVTGAPKIRAMQLIRELERSPRGVYCGAIGYVGPGSTAFFNVAIRTIEIECGRGTLGTGSGIVWDSDGTEEFAEGQLKMKFFQDVTRSAVEVQ